MATVTIATWNVNGLRSAYRSGFRTYLERFRPDVLCLQEIRATPQQLDATMQPPSDYYAYYAPARIRAGYSGVAVMTRIRPQSVHEGVGIERFDIEGRLLRVDFKRVSILCVYVPKGYSPDDARHAPEKVERLHFKLEFCRQLLSYVKHLRKQGRLLIISGDFNTALTELDLARPAENERTSGFLPEERQMMQQFLDAGFVDVFRCFVKGGGQYTWWSQRRGARERNIGWRIDYHLVSAELVQAVRSAYLQPEVQGSDHCPAVIALDAELLTEGTR